MLQKQHIQGEISLVAAVQAGADCHSSLCGTLTQSHLHLNTGWSGTVKTQTIHSLPIVFVHMKFTYIQHVLDLSGEIYYEGGNKTLNFRQERVIFSKIKKNTVYVYLGYLSTLYCTAVCIVGNSVYQPKSVSPF